MLQPNRLTLRPLGRRKIVNSRLVRFRPSRYTASYSTRCTSRQARGKSSRSPSDPRETVASLLASCREYFASTLCLHARAEAVLLVAGAHVRLKCPFRHRSISSAWLALLGGGLRARMPFEAYRELRSVCDPSYTVKEPSQLLHAQSEQAFRLSLRRGYTFRNALSRLSAFCTARSITISVCQNATALAAQSGVCSRENLLRPFLLTTALTATSEPGSSPAGRTAGASRSTSARATRNSFAVRASK